MKIIYVFSEPPHIMPSVIKSLPSIRFLKRSWQHIAPETTYQPLIQTSVCKKSSYLNLECFHECVLNFLPGYIFSKKCGYKLLLSLSHRLQKNPLLVNTIHLRIIDMKELPQLCRFPTLQTLSIKMKGMQ